MQAKFIHTRRWSAVFKEKYFNRRGHRRSQTKGSYRGQMPVQIPDAHFCYAWKAFSAGIPLEILFGYRSQLFTMFVETLFSAHVHLVNSWCTTKTKQFVLVTKACFGETAVANFSETHCSHKWPAGRDKHEQNGIGEKLTLARIVNKCAVSEVMTCHRLNTRKRLLCLNNSFEVGNTAKYSASQLRATNSWCDC